MASKKESASMLPSDDFTWTDGSNYGLDGFYHTQTIGEGIKASFGTVQGMSGIPQDLFAEEQVQEAPPSYLDEDSLKLDAFVGCDKPYDVSMGEVTPDQDLANSFEAPKPFARYDVQDRVAVYSSEGSEVDGYAFEAACQQAHVRSHLGHSLESIYKGLRAALGKDKRIAGVMGAVAAGHGLAGTVYLDLQYFPSVKNDKRMAAFLRKTGARYAITPDPALAAKIGKVAVEKVPWKQAAAFYGPRLLREGYSFDKAASGVREALRGAILRGPQQATKEASVIANKVQAENSLSANDAFARFAAMGPREVEVLKKIEVDTQARLAKDLAQWVKQGSLSQEMVDKLLASKLSSEKIREKVADYLQQKMMANQEYASKRYSAHRGEVKKASEVTIEDVVVWAVGKFAVHLDRVRLAGEVSQRWPEHLVRQAMPAIRDQAKGVERAKVKAMLEKSNLPMSVVKGAKSLKEAQLLIAQHLGKASAQSYSGSDLAAAPVELKASEAKIRETEVQGLLKWAKVQLEKGVVGPDLDEALVTRWQRGLLERAAGHLVDLRKEYESGEEQGSLKRVLEMSQSEDDVTFYNAEEFSLQSPLDSALNLSDQETLPGLDGISFGGISLNED